MKLYRRKANSTGPLWSDEEEALLLSTLQTDGFKARRLAELFPDRTSQAIRSKVRRVRIQHDLFGSSYRQEKEDFTMQIASATRPKVVFDAYAGVGHQTFRWIEVADTVFATELKASKLDQFRLEAEKQGFMQREDTRESWYLFEKAEKKIYFFSGDALEALNEIKYHKIKVDLIDLDTCGSTLPTLPYFLLQLKPKHLVITHGEFHSMRFQREDVLRRLFTHRDVTKTPLPMTVDEMATELDKAVKISALRAHNETIDSFWLELKQEVWLGTRIKGMLRRYYSVTKPSSTADCLNILSGL